MKTPKTIRYFRAATEKAGSQNKLAGILKVSPPTIAFYLAGAIRPSDDILVKLADFLGKDPVKILVEARIEKEHGLARPVWQKILSNLTAAAVAGMIVLPAVVPLQVVNPALYIMLNSLIMAVVFGTLYAPSPISRPMGGKNVENP